MKNLFRFALQDRRKMFFLMIPIAFFGLSPASSPVLAQIGQLTETPQERELYNTLPGDSQNGSLIDPTNPMDLLNRLRRATAMDNATNPSDAIDEALKDFEVNDSVQP